MRKIPHDLVLASERLELREVSEENAKTVFELLTPEITRHMAFFPPKTVAEERSKLKKCLRENLGGLAWHAGFFEKSTGEFVGMGGVAEYFEETGTAEIWYWIAVKKQGKGYATEAVKAICAHLFDECDANRVLIRVDVDNLPSRAVAEKSGAKLDGVLRAHVLRKGDLRDTAFYTLFPGELA